MPASRPLAADSPLRPDPAPLPRHRHGLSRAEITGSQHGRLVAATADVVAERGYSNATVAAIAKRAGVSTKTFYEFFANKEDAFLGAYETIDLVIGRMIEVATGPPGADEPAAGDPRSMVRLAIGEYLRTLAGEPAFTRMLVIEALGAGPRALERRRQAFERIAELIAAPLEAARRDDPALPEVDRTMLIALLGAVNELCVQHITADRPETLPVIAADVERVTARICFGE